MDTGLVNDDESDGLFDIDDVEVWSLLHLLFRFVPFFLSIYRFVHLIVDYVSQVVCTCHTDFRLGAGVE